MSRHAAQSALPWFSSSVTTSATLFKTCSGRMIITIRLSRSERKGLTKDHPEPMSTITCDITGSHITATPATNRGEMAVIEI